MVLILEIAAGVLLGLLLYRYFDHVLFFAAWGFLAAVAFAILGFLGLVFFEIPRQDQIFVLFLIALAAFAIYAKIKLPEENARRTALGLRPLGLRFYMLFLVFDFLRHCFIGAAPILAFGGGIFLAAQVGNYFQHPLREIMQAFFVVLSFILPILIVKLFFRRPQMKNPLQGIKE